MTKDELLDLCATRGIVLGVEADQLKVRAAKGALDEPMRRMLREYKQPLVEWLSSNKSGDRMRDVPSIHRVMRAAAAPASLAQQRLWFIDQLEGGGAAYHVRVAIRLYGVLHREALRGSLDTILERHEALRTTFAQVSGELRQVIAQSARFALQEADLSGYSVKEREAQIAGHIAEESAHRFELSTGPLIRGRLVRVGAEEHVLLLTMHHIVSDGWSVGLLLGEIKALYAAYREDRASPLAALPIQYADYAAWQRKWLQGEVLQDQSDYWKKQLTGAPALLELPTDRPRPTVQSYRGESVAFTLSAELAEQLKELAKRHDATLFMMVYAGLAVVLSRLSGQEDVVIGVPVANRQRVELEGLIGFFVNMLALRVQVRASESVSELLSRVRGLMLGGYGHQEIPFEQVVESLQPPRSLSHSPIFQIGLSWQNTLLAGPAEQWLPGLKMRALAVPNATAKFDLSWALQETEGQITGAVHYASDLFDRETVERWIGHFRHVLSEMARDARQPVGEISLLDSAQCERLLREFNATEVLFPREKVIHELFEAQARQAPDALAVVYEDQHLTYAELNRRSNQLAHYLRRQGVGPDQTVALHVERGLEMMVGLLGILKAGGAYVPLEPSYPPQRLEYMLADTAPRVLLTQAHLKKQWPEFAGPRVVLDSDWAQIEREAQDNLDPNQVGVTARHLAYVIYTSGSTGQPKGVMVEHRNVVSLWASLERRIYRGACRNVTVNASLAFDASVKQWVQILSGRTLVLVPSAVRADEKAWLAYIARHQADVLDLTPSQLRPLIDAGLLDAIGHTPKIALVGGEAIDRRLWNVLGGAGAAAGATQFYNLYGPTEATVDAAVTEVDRSAIPILGRPIPNARIYILDSRRRPVGIGVTGEIYIGGAGVARGYLNRADLTAERFVKDPFSADEFARMYRTGDLGRWRADGNVEFLGRNDHQVKIRGFRIELGEIEAALSSRAGVREVAVVAREDVPGEQRLVAYYSAGESDPGTEELRSHMKERLPEYMLPTAYVRLERLPLTSNGKLDRKALPAPDLSALSMQQYEAPQGEIEGALASIWQELLNVERVGRRDNFFELGGHSLLTIRLIAQVRKLLGRKLTLEDFFDHPTIQSLSPLLSQAASVTTLPIERADRSRPLPLSLAQQRLWFIEQLGSVGSAYHLAGAVRLKGALDVQALQSALDAIVLRHEVLRTVFRNVDGQATQIIGQNVRFALAMEDLRGLARQEREKQIPRLLRQEANRVFDLSEGPLIRGRLFRLDQAEHILLFTMHHLVADGWSIGVLIRELRELYAAQCEGRPDSLPMLRTQYADYAQWQRKWLTGEVLQEQLSYWKQHLQGAPALLELPTDRPRPAMQSFAGASLWLSLGAELTRKVKALARRFDSTLYMTLYAAWVVLLSRLSGQRDIVIGTPVANRQRPEVEGLIGFFINTLPLRMQLHDELRVSELLRQVRELTLAAYAHQEVPFEQIVEVLQPQRSLSYGAVVQVLFTFQNAPHSELELPGLRLVPERIPGSAAQFDLTLLLQELHGEISGGINYATALFDAGTIERWIGHYKTLLEALTQDSEQSILAVPLLQDNERQQIVAGFNSTHQELPCGVLIHELFEEQVRRTPDAVALLYDNQQLSYAQLNDAADQLARYLCAQGLGPEQVVGLCVERGVEMVVGLLGILKAGGAYLPLDPAWPPARLRGMIEDAAPRVLLTQARLDTEWASDCAKIVALDTQWNEIAASEPEPIFANAQRGSNRLAYVIFTSGSTGRPKGVMVNHAGVVNFLRSMQQRPGVESMDCVLAITTLSFDIAALELYLPLISGARLALASREEALDPTLLAAALDRYGVTVLQATPVTWRSLIDSGWKGRPTLTALCGGEALTTQLASQIEPLVKALWNLYGPTETTIWSTARQITKPQQDTDGPIQSIGAPIANTRVYILDEQQRPVPIGTRGEVFIGGAGVARGYLNRPDLTADRFVNDPFSAAAQAQMYRTGDLGRWRPDGNIEFLGRADQQVKLRGFRIELGEIEALLSTHEGVGEVAVVAREDVPGEQRLVAYYSATEEGPSIEELQAHIKRRLPEYMLPAAYVRLERLPLTSNGKLDRNGLPMPDMSALQVQQWEPPQGETEAALAAVWQALLHVERVGRRDNFFQLGGHSFLAVQMLDRLRRMNISAAVRDVFTSRDLAQLAAVVQTRTVQVPPTPLNLIPAGCHAIDPAMLTLLELEQQHLDQIVKTVPGGAANVEDIYPLAPLQEGFLFHHLLNERGGDAYVRSILLSVASRERLVQLIAALQGMIERHDVLRTAVLWEQLPRPVQVVVRTATLPVEELTLEPDSEPLEQLQSLASSGTQRLNLRLAPLMRLCVAPDRLGSTWYALLQTHHLVLDNQSLQSLLEQVAARLAGQTEHAPKSAPYRDYVFHALSRTRHSDAASFFKSKLGDVDEPTAAFGLMDVHGDGARLSEARGNLDPALALRLRALSRRQRTSPATLFHSVWALVVSITSGRDDVVYGTVLLGMQAGSDTERVFGMTINTLPLRLNLRDVSAGELVEQTHREFAELLHYDQTALAVAQRCSAASRSTPLFNTLLNFRRATQSVEPERIGATGVSIVASVGRTNYPFTLSVDDCGETFALKMECDRRVDPQRMLEYLHTAVQSLVEALERAPQTPALALSVLPESERRQIHERFNRTQADYPQRKLVHELFEDQVLRTPDAAALMYEGHSLTYAELNAKANQLARHLRERGVGPDQLVGICTDRSPEMVIGLLGILKAGGAYVPMDPGYPAERLAYMLGDAAPGVLLIQAHLNARVPAVAAERIALDADWSTVARHSSVNLDADALGLRPHHLAYVIYTSGSTGQPKGAMNEHRGVVNRLQWMQDAYRLDAHERVLQKTPFSFDVSVWEFFWTLMSGACVVIARPEGHKDPAYLRELIEQTGVTTLHFVPSMLRHFLDSFRPGECRSVRHVVCSGEELPASLQKMFFDCLPSARLSNLYGPTEAAVDVTAWECQPADQASRVPIGRPISNIRIYILDRHGRSVPIGVTGELYIAGVGVGRGYLNRNELTTMRFVPDPFCVGPQARMYKTGDLARWRSDGAIEYLGRNDHQVKIRGFRIELGEIESRLAQHPCVKEAVVVTREEGTGAKRLVAYVTPRDQDLAQGTLAAEALRAHLSAVLPDYMIPAAFVTLEQLPLTANGKLDRRALPVPERDACATRYYEVPLGEVEEILAGIWQELLGVDRVGRWDNFFELGGHSLLIVQMLQRLRRVGLFAEVLRVFDIPTLADLAAALIPEPAGNFAAPPNLIPAACQEITPEMLPLVQLCPDDILRIVRSVPGGASNIQDIYPLAPMQDGILFHHLMSEQGDAYVLSTLVEVQSRAELNALLSALQAVIDRHDLLRSAVLWEGLPRPVQVVYRNAQLPVDEVIPEGRTDALEELKARMAPKRLWIDVRRAPLLRAQIAPAADGVRWYVLLLQHHLINDHVGQEILLKELKAHLAGHSEQLARPVAYRDFVWQALARAERSEVETYFRKKLGDIEEPTTLFGLLDVYGDGAEIEQSRIELEDELSRRVRSTARGLGVSPATLFHAAWSLVVARTSGRDDIVFGSVLLGRMRGGKGIERAMGMFINTLPLRIRLKHQSAEQLVRQVQREIVELLQHEQASLAVVQRCSGIVGARLLFNAVLNYRHSAHRAEPQERARSSGIRSLAFQERSNYPFSISVSDFGEGFGIVAQTSQGVDPQRVASYLHVAMLSLMNALESDPQKLSLALNILPDSERHQLLHQFNSTEAKFPREKVIHELFEAQAQRTPTAIAVADDEAAVTYEELDHRANQLAHYLSQRGVSPGAHVALLLPRSLDLVTAQLAVLKCAAAYVPLDSGLPGQRLQFLLQDCAARCVVSVRAQTLAEGVDAQRIDLEHVPWESLPAEKPEVRSAQDSESTAYVMYTSGSTGEPKGVVVPHRAISRLVLNNGYASLQAEDRIAFTANPAFDASTFEVWGALLNGAAVVIIPRETVLDTDRFARALKHARVTTLFLTTALFNQCVQTQPGMFSQLKYLLFGGENCDVRRVRQLLEQSPPRHLLHVYGPTESTTFASCHEIRELSEQAESVPIGRPIANTRIYILDECGVPVPRAVVGELYIGGAGVARGYLNREQLTQERFPADPFSAEPGATMYRTGDLGRYLPDGSIEFLGRSDHQVKIRGYRIELGEIEAQLGLHEQVREAVVMAREEDRGEKRLVAYLTLNQETSAKALRDFLRARLPEFMLPSMFVILESLPLTPNGKVDRKALLLVESVGQVPAETYVAPATAAESVIAGIWTSLLQVQPIGVHDNFFEIGGHSLLLVQFAARVRDVFQVSLTLKQIFDRPTVAGVVEELTRMCGDRVLVEELAAVYTSVATLSDDDVRAALMQERLYE